jgi:hypothetical protein
VAEGVIELGADAPRARYGLGGGLPHVE